MTAVVLDGARIVQHDSVEARSLAFNGGVVVAQSPRDAVHIDVSDHLIFPGLINAHDHLQLNNIPPLPHDAPFPNSYAWIDAFEVHRQRADVDAAVAVPRAARLWHGGLKNAFAGATTVAHHDPWYETLDDPAFPVRVVRDSGWSHSLGLGLPHGELPPRYGPSVTDSFAKTPRHRPWIIHLAEGTDAVARAELDQLDALGCLASNTVLVHGAGLTDANVKRVIERGAAVVWCPASNLELLGGTLEPHRLAKARRLALGTDSRLTGARDLLDELRVAATCGGLSPRDLLRLVTTDAADILRLENTGALSPGFRADCMIVRPVGDPHESLLNTRRAQIRAVIRDGRPVIADPDVADWFAACDVTTLRVRLDGAEKLLDARLATSDAARLESGLVVDRTR
ncbi:MAG TPA: amidohydrolase family protein [Gemmatimonadaceae bacterium]